MDVLPLAGRVAFFWSKTVAHEVSQGGRGAAGERTLLFWAETEAIAALSNTIHGCRQGEGCKA